MECKSLVFRRMLKSESPVESNSCGDGPAEVRVLMHNLRTSMNTQEHPIRTWLTVHVFKAPGKSLHTLHKTFFSQPDKDKIISARNSSLPVFQMLVRKITTVATRYYVYWVMLTSSWFLIMVIV